MPPAPPMMAHLLSLGTQSKDAVKALKTEWCVCGACVPATVSARASPRVRDSGIVTEKEVFTSYNKCCTSEQMCLSVCVCHRCFLLASERVFIHILTGAAPGCHSTSASEACLPAYLPCSINKPVSLNPNLASPQTASAQHQWYMCSSGRVSVLSFLSVMDGGFCRPVNTQSEPHCPDLRYSSTQVTLSEARHFNHSKQQLHTAKIGVWVGCVYVRVCVCVFVFSISLSQAQL